MHAEPCCLQLVSFTKKTYMQNDAIDTGSIYRYPIIYHISILFRRDRFRTMTNVTGDSLGAGIVYHLSKHELPPMHHEDGYEMTSADGHGKQEVPNGTDSMTAV